MNDELLRVLQSAIRAAWTDGNKCSHKVKPAYVDDYVSTHVAALAEAIPSFDAGLEAAAKVCDVLASQYWKEYKTGDGPGRAHPHYQGLSDGASDCANAIRALKGAPGTEGKV
jgi:hypothetical protein